MKETRTLSFCCWGYQIILSLALFLHSESPGEDEIKHVGLTIYQNNDLLPYTALPHYLSSFNKLWPKHCSFVRAQYFEICALLYLEKVCSFLHETGTLHFLHTAAH